MSQPTSSNLNDEKITQQATQWLVVLDDDPSEETLKQFEHWLAQKPQHQTTFKRLQALIHEIESVTEHIADHENSKNIINQAINQQKKTASYFKASILSLAVLGSTVLISALQYAPMRYWMADQRNTSQSWQQYRLEDASQIHVAGKTAYNIEYDATQRKIFLSQGNILVDVVQDKNRPFIIQTQQGKIQALGTRFIVTQQENSTVVTMLESKTLVWSNQNPQQKVQLVAGQRLELKNNRLISTQPIHINARLFEQAWQKRILIANGDDLVDVLDQLSLFYSGKISFDRQALANIKVTATLPLDNIDAVLQQLAQELDLNIQQSIPYLTLISKK